MGVRNNASRPRWFLNIIESTFSTLSLPFSGVMTKSLAHNTNPSPSFMKSLFYLNFFRLFLLFIPWFVVFNAGAQDCGVVTTLYQTEGSTGTQRVLRYNPFIQEYVQVGSLQGATAATSSNSAYNAITQTVYSSEGGNVMRSYDPANNYQFLGDLTIDNLTTAGGPGGFNNTLFAQDEFIGRVDADDILLIDIDGLALPATIDVTDTRVQVITKTNANPGSTPGIPTTADYAFIDGFIYGIDN